MQQQQQQMNMTKSKTSTTASSSSSATSLDVVQSLYHLMKSSLGPLGHDKLMRDELGALLLTNDGVTILNHVIPTLHNSHTNNKSSSHSSSSSQSSSSLGIGRLLLDVSMSQDGMSGDGTTSVLLIACELLMQYHALCYNNNHSHVSSSSSSMGRGGGGGGSDHHHLSLNTVLNGMNQAKDYCIQYLLSHDHKNTKSSSSDNSDNNNDNGSTQIQLLIERVLDSKNIKFYKHYFSSLLMQLFNEPSSSSSSSSPFHNNNNTNSSSSSGSSKRKRNNVRIDRVCMTNGLIDDSFVIQNGVAFKVASSLSRLFNHKNSNNININNCGIRSSSSNRLMMKKQQTSSQCVVSSNQIIIILPSSSSGVGLLNSSIGNNNKRNPMFSMTESSVPSEDQGNKKQSESIDCYFQSSREQEWWERLIAHYSSNKKHKNNNNNDNDSKSGEMEQDKVLPLFVFMSGSFPYRTLSYHMSSLNSDGESPICIFDHLSEGDLNRLRQFIANGDKDGSDGASSSVVTWLSDDYESTIDWEDEETNAMTTTGEKTTSDDQRYFTLSEYRTLNNHDDECLLIIEENDDCHKNNSHGTIVIHGPSDIIVQEIDRALNDAISVVQKLLLMSHDHESVSIFPSSNANTMMPTTDDDKSDQENQKMMLVGGGGNVEMNLWRALNEYSLKIFDSKIQIVIRAFAEALLVIPRQLLASVCKVQDIEFEMSKLKALYRSQQNESNDNQTPDHWLPYGVDVTLPEGGSKICNVLERGIIDSVQTKKTMIQLAAEACVMILRIDETIHPA